MKRLTFLILAMAMIVGCGDSKDNKQDRFAENDLVGKWKLTFHEGRGDEGGYILYEFKEDGTGRVTEIDSGRIDDDEAIKKWYYDSDRETIICLVIDGHDGDTYPMELEIAQMADKKNMKWIWVGEDNDTAYPVVKLN